MFISPSVSHSVPSSPVFLQLLRNYKLFPISNILHILYPLLRQLFIPPQLGNLRLSFKTELKIHRLRRLSLTTNLHENHCSFFFPLGCFSQFIVTSIIFIYWLCHAACGNLVPWPKIELRFWAVRAGSPNHWASREFSTYPSMLLMSVTECGLVFYIPRTSLHAWELAQCLAHNRHEREWFFLSSKIFFYIKVTWVWVDSGSWWWTGRPGVRRFMGLQRVGHDWATELNWTLILSLYSLLSSQVSGRKLI